MEPSACAATEGRLHAGVPKRATVGISTDRGASARFESSC